MSQEIIDAFHKLYFESLIWKESKWLGVPTLKNPFDLQIYQEILYEVKPDVIVETGRYRGGSAFFFASIFDLLGKGRVISIDNDPESGKPDHPRIEYVDGSSIDPRVVEEVRKRVSGKVMVVLDSDHHKGHVYGEMCAYHPLVSEGSYLVVEDGNINGHPVFQEFGPGPAEAIAQFLRENKDFVIDRSREKYFFTFNPGGYLKRKEGKDV